CALFDRERRGDERRDHLDPIAVGVDVQEAASALSLCKRRFADTGDADRAGHVPRGLLELGLSASGDLDQQRTLRRGVPAQTRSGPLTGGVEAIAESVACNHLAAEQLRYLDVRQQPAGVWEPR